MAGDKTSEYLSSRRSEITNADYDDDITDAILDFLDAYNPDSFHIEPPIIEGKDKRESALSTSSRLNYASTLHRTAKYVHLLDCTARELNQHASARLNGTHETVPDDGITENTVHQNQIAWRSFYRFHVNHPQGHDVTADPDAITLVDREETSVDERDMFDSEEIQAMRDACLNKRDRALLEMLIYTGQRHNALRRLKCKDVQPDEGESGTIYLPDEEGMKGAEGKRPLLGAQKHAREWKRAHPTQDPDHAFFTHTYDWSGHDDIEQGDHISRQSFGDIPQNIAERAGVDKPANPHQFRHYFAHMLAAKHGMSFDTIRHLLGHEASSRELERTYQHLVDDDYIESAEVTMNITDSHEESLTPPQCFTCDEPLEPSWSVCPECERRYGPDVQSLDEEIQERTTEGALDATTDTQKEDMKELLDILDDPEVINQLVALGRELDDDEDVFDALG